jgi:aspartate aminotransferase
MREWFSARTRRLQVSGIRKIFELAREGSINLGLGELDFEPSECAKKALAQAVNDGHNGYGPTRGVPELRKMLADELTRYRDDVEMENVIITSGATQGLLVTAMTLFDHGDEILVPDPGFVIYQPHVIMCGSTPVKYSLKQENRFQPNLEEIHELITSKTKAIVVNSPNNPTSGMMDSATVRGLRDLAVDHDLVIISDEVYDNIVFDEEHHSMLDEGYDHLVYINSFSKTYAMTGWRIGYMASSKYIINQIAKIHYYNIACPPTPLQMAVMAVMKAPRDDVAERAQILKRRRDVMVKRLNATPGFTCLEPPGAFYTFPSFDHDISSEDFAMKLLDAGLICAHGSAFGKGGEGHLRFSFANSIENIEKGMDIVEKVAETIHRRT